MSVIHSWALGLGLLAIGLPVLIHVLTRPKPVELPLSTIRFVHEIVEQYRARHRLRDVLILILRCLAIAVLAGAFARPLLGERGRIDPPPEGSKTRVVVCDVSQSMAAQSKGVQLFERARAVAQEYLTYAPDLRVNLILGSAAAAPASHSTTTNFALIRSILGAAEVQPTEMNPNAGIAAAAESLREGGDGSLELVVISDFQATNWQNADFSAVPAGTTVRLESLAPSEPLSNLAILGARPRSPLVAGEQNHLDVILGNYSQAPADVTVSVTLERQVLALEGLCAPGTTTTVSTPVVFQTAGWKFGQAAISGRRDALRIDDVHHLALEVRRQPTILLLTNELPRHGPSSSFYLERALDPFGDGGHSRILRMSPEDLSRQTAADADVIILSRPGNLSPEQVVLLSALVRRGRGLLYCAAHPTDAANLTRLSEQISRTEALPVTFQPSATHVPGRIQLASVSQDQAPFAVFGDHLAEALGHVELAGALQTQPSGRGAPEDVLATYEDGSAFVVCARMASGGMAVLNSDLAESALPRLGAFVPLINEIVELLLDDGQGVSSNHCGQRLFVHLPRHGGGLEGLSVEGPGTDVGGRFIETDQGIVWHWESLGAPGIYKVVSRERVEYGLGVNIPEQESDLRGLSPEIMSGWRAGRVSVMAQRSMEDPDRTRDTAWSWLCAGCLMCLVAELLVLKWFRT